MSATESPTWERRPGEPPEAYTRFLAYRNLGPTRSLLAAYVAYLDSASKAANRRKKPQVPGNWLDESSRWQWPDRAAMWDIRNLETHGRELAILWFSILTAAVRKAAQKLADPDCQPESFRETLGVISAVAPYLTPEVLRGLSPPSSGHAAAVSKERT